jgi:hypothetical protein
MYENRNQTRSPRIPQNCERWNIQAMSPSLPQEYISELISALYFSNNGTRVKHLTYCRRTQRIYESKIFENILGKIKRNLYKTNKGTR